MGKKALVVLLVVLALPLVHLAEAQKVAHSSLLENGSLSVTASLTDAFVKLMLSLVPAYAQEEVSSSSEGMDNEAAGSKWRRGQCIGEPDFFYLANVAGKAVFSDFGLGQGADVGQPRKDFSCWCFGRGSDLATIAAKGPPGVIGYINFSGGAVGSPRESPGKSCKPETYPRYSQNSGRPRAYHHCGCTPKMISIGVRMRLRSGTRRLVRAGVRPNL